ncbi:two-component system sensor kinase [Streptomyces viridochromogenes DSM 40736]|uniref:histidine kinase n=1 Tax=Streptomyces viridochromogenes (strain DSM 40736 / JCM 4977 / BCRC 1201 / Tue 494) TaxID=591159 RepID=D9X2F8_STRVT|nr:HAMP domain-containing sensor histidine kinase [Streptomyces viridochromogenes]EFL33627.1 two-component system sensor kinase [Streptomyces viridochromogenes DSM 40736]
MTRRLLAGYLGLVLLVLLGLEIPFGLLFARAETSRLSNSMERDAGMLAELAEERIEENNTDELPELATEYAERTGARVVVVDRTGAVLTDSASTTPAGADLSAQPDIATALRNRTTVGTSPDPDSGTETRYVTVPGSSGETIRGALRLSYPTDVLDGRVRDIWFTLALTGLGVLAAAALIALALARWIIRPVHALERATTQLADGTLTHLPATDLGPPELRRLAASFTHTATRLQHLLAAQRAFAAEASHQLKTPLTALRIRLENFEPHLDPAVHDSLDEAIGETERLGRMIQGLLSLARLESAATTPEASDLDAVVADRAATWAPFAAEHDVRIATTGRPAGHVWAIPGALEQIIDNLLANALRVAPSGSTVTLAVRHVPHGIELHVIDQGPGMSETERRRAFDRFWRASDTHHDGTGLGLPIVRHLVDASGGAITLDPAPGSGLDARVRLRPVAIHPTRLVAGR